MTATVLAVHMSAEHSFSKTSRDQITLLTGIGVDGDAHSGATVKHRSRVRRDPKQPNLRQVHLLHEEVFEELSTDGYDLVPGEIGENITTRGVDLLTLPRDTVLWIGSTVAVRITGFRAPCVLMDRHKPGLMKAFLYDGPDGKKLGKSGVMSVVEVGGNVSAGDEIRIELPMEPHFSLEKA